MTFKFQERPGARRQTISPPYFEVGYIAYGSFDQASVRFLAQSLTAPVVAVEEGLLFRQDMRISEQGFEIWHVDVPYGPNNNATGSLRFSGSTTGGSFHITHSRETVNSYPPASAIDYKRAINVRKRGKEQEIDGTDIIIPALKLSYTLKHPMGFINESFARAVGRITATSNSDLWRGFNAGELLFLGCDFTDGTDADAEATYHFAAEENLTGLIIGTIEDIEKDGHDLLWVSWEDDNTGDEPSVNPVAVYIERLYRRIAYGATFAF